MGDTFAGNVDDERFEVRWSTSAIRSPNSPAACGRDRHVLNCLFETPQQRRWGSRHSYCAHDNYSTLNVNTRTKNIVHARLYVRGNACAA